MHEIQIQYIITIHNKIKVKFAFQNYNSWKFLSNYILSPDNFILKFNKLICEFYFFIVNNIIKIQN